MLVRGWRSSAAWRRFFSCNAWIQQQVDGLDFMDSPGTAAYANMIQECSDAHALEPGRCLHEKMRKRGMCGERYVQNLLIQMYGKCGSLGEAKSVFDNFGDDEKTVFSWNIMIDACVQNADFAMAMETYDSMNVPPSAVTLVTILNACASLGSLEKASEVHAKAKELKLHTNPIVATALVTTLSKCGHLDSAKAAFAGMPLKDVVAWTSMISGFAQNGHGRDALKTFSKMACEGVKPDCMTAVSLLDACCVLRSWKLGSWVHEMVIRYTSLCFVPIVGNALISMYAKCGDLPCAWKVFQEMDTKDVVSWNTMISAYAQNGHCSKALLLYRDGLCKFKSVSPNAVTFVTLLDACGSCGDLENGVLVRNDAARHGLDAQTMVSNALITMYGRCGKLETAREIFDRMHRDTVSWNSLISLYVQNNMDLEALELYKNMDVKPDAVTLTNVLAACRTLNNLPEGKIIHERVRECGFEGVVGVANSLISMYAKCGSMKDAEKIFKKMANKGIVTWNAMMSAYSENGEAPKALKVLPLMDLEGLKPNDVTFIAIFSSCTRMGLLDDAWEYFTCMIEECKIEPSEQHFGCTIDLLGRVGKLDWIKNIVDNMPGHPGATVWKSILDSCNVHGDVERAEYAAEKAIELDPSDSGIYTTLCNIYKAAERWEDIEKVKKKMESNCFKGSGGNCFKASGGPPVPLKETMVTLAA